MLPERLRSAICMPVCASGCDPGRPRFFPRKGDSIMAYTLPALPYANDALEPYIDAKTMEIHHDRHHGTYVTNLNDALKGTGLDDQPIEQLIANLDKVPEAVRVKVRNNGGGHANHSMFWTLMGKG